MKAPWVGRLRGLLSLVMAGVVLYLFWPLLAEMRAAVELLQTVRWPWLAAALLLQIAGYASLTALNYWLLLPFVGRISFRRLLAVLPAIAFIEVAVPSAGASGVVLRARLLGQSGYSAEASTFTLALENLFEGGVRALILLAGLWYLLNRGELSAAQLVYLSGFGLVTIAGLGALWYYGREQRQIEAGLLRLVRTWNRLARRLRQQPYPAAPVRARTQVFYQGLAQLRRAPAWRYALAATGHIGLDAASLGACFLAFDFALPLGTLLTGYSLTLLVSGLAVLPGALALTEASLAVIFNQLSVPGEIAIAAALAYRLSAFWLLRLIGFICWQLLEAQHETRSATPTAL